VGGSIHEQVPAYSMLTSPELKLIAEPAEAEPVALVAYAQMNKSPDVGKATKSKCQGHLSGSPRRWAAFIMRRDHE
jgi:hypothetical protein